MSSKKSNFNIDNSLDDLQKGFVKVSTAQTLSEVQKAIEDVKTLISAIHKIGLMEGFEEGFEEGFDKGSKINISL